ncbi:MAG: GFA family protein [Halioglobus sp.]|nr:GFA family protein [Halioglobus sp.]
MTRGSCLCGEVRFNIEGDFEHFFICHCSYCRKDSGSAHAANLFTHKSALTWLSGQDKVTDFLLKDSRHTKSFCSICGSAMPIVEADNDMCIVPAGCLDDEVPVKPEAHIFTASQAGWEKELATTKRFPELPE